MKYLLFFFAVLFLSGCMSVKKIEKHCDDFAKICVTETKTETSYRDTTIFVKDSFFVDKIIKVPISGDSLRIQDSVKTVPGIPAYYQPLPFRSLVKSQGLIGMEISGRWKNIDARAYLSDSTILYNYKDTLTYQDSITIANAVMDKTVNNTITLPPVKYVPKFYTVILWLFIIENLILLILLYLKFSFTIKKFFS